MRKEKNIDWNTELLLTNKLGHELIKAGFNASNSIVITVSTDYSSIVGQILRHQLSFDGEIVEGFGVDVPYPDQKWDDSFLSELDTIVKTHIDKLKDKTLILVEAGVIRGGNYTYLVEWLRQNISFDLKIVTLALFENTGSKFKSDFVGEYYDDTTEDLTFWWENYNKHWV